MYISKYIDIYMYTCMHNFDLYIYIYMCLLKHIYIYIYIYIYVITETSTVEMRGSHSGAGSYFVRGQVASS